MKTALICIAIIIVIAGICTALLIVRVKKQVFDLEDWSDDEGNIYQK